MNRPGRRNSAWFRLLLWWGVETTMELLVRPRRQTPIIRWEKTPSNILPKSLWSHRHARSVCMTLDCEEKEIVIHEFLLRMEGADRK